MNFWLYKITRPVNIYRPLFIASWLDLFNARLAIVSVCMCMCVWICFERWLKFQSIYIYYSQPNICLLIEMIKLGAIHCCIESKQAACKRVFMFTGRLYWGFRCWLALKWLYLVTCFYRVPRMRVMVSCSISLCFRLVND